MQKSFRKNLITLLTVSFCAVFTAFAEINVISPAEGSWSNKQMLVVDTSEGGDYFYSVDGSDPKDFGFIYDSPVLLNLEGKISVNIFHIAEDGTEETKQINYSVNSDNAQNKTYSQFISLFYDTGIFNYSSGSTLQVPPALSYSLNSEKSFLKGRNLKLDSSNVLSRYISCVVKAEDSGKSWRFVIKTYPKISGINSLKNVPFRIENWDTLVFTDKNLLYKIDDEYWCLPEENRVLDRSVSHTIYWQDLNYKKDNKVESSVLPPKPELKSRVLENGALEFYSDNSSDCSFSVATVDSKGKYTELYSKISCDVFYGDAASGLLKIGVFADSVFQGEIYQPYSVNKLVPDSPQIIPDFQDFYSRNNIHLSIKAKDGEKLFVSVNRPLLIKDVTKLDEDLISTLKATEILPFREYSSGAFDINLVKNSGGAMFYKVQAYSENKIDKSPVAEYFVIIDSYNYFYDSQAAFENADGSAARPYNSLVTCLEQINKCKSVRLYLKGDAMIPENTILNLKADCIVKNDENTVLTFQKGSALNIHNSNLKLEGLKINKLAGDDKVILPVFKLDHSTLEIKDCVISTDFSKNGTMISADNSVISIQKSVASVYSSVYSSFISAQNSDVFVKESVLNTSADQTVILSLNDCTVDFCQNQLKVTGKRGRVCELYGCNGNLDSNAVKFELSNINEFNDLFYLNDKSELSLKDNINYGL